MDGLLDVPSAALRPEQILTIGKKININPSA